MRALQQADNPIRIPHGRILGRCNHNRFICTGNGILKSLLDSSRTIDNDVFEFLFQFKYDIFHLLRRNGILVFGLGAGSIYSSSKRLSLISAWLSRHRPSATSHKSYIIRFSRPITTSKLRRPMSVSTRHTFFRAVPKLCRCSPMSSFYRLRLYLKLRRLPLPCSTPL